MASKVLITAVRQTVYRDLMEKYENPIEHTCDEFGFVICKLIS